MRRFFLSIIFASMLGLAYADVLPINQWGGLDSDNDPLLIKEGMAQDSENVSTDYIFGLSPRKGFVTSSTEASTGLWNFPLSNGSQYVITASSGVLKASLSGSIFNVPISTYDQTARIAAASLGDKFYWASSDGLKHWDTANVIVDSFTLNFTLLAPYKGRLAGAGRAGDTRTIYLSEYLNGSNFQLAVNPTDTDPIRQPIQGNNNENITTLFSSFKDKLIWATANSFGGLSGSRRSTLSMQVFSDNVGSAYPESFRDCDGLLRFLGSNRTVWEFDGAIVKPISRDIDTQLALITQGDANSRSFTQSNQADWSQGYSRVGLDTNIAPGDVDFKPQVAIITSTDDFDDNDYASSPTWTVSAGSFVVTSGELRSGQETGTGLYLGGIIYTTSTISTGTWELQGGSPYGGGVPGSLWSLNSEFGGSFNYYFMAGANDGTLGYRFHFAGGSFNLDRSNSINNSFTNIFSSAVSGTCSILRVNRVDPGIFTTTITCSGSGTQRIVAVDTWVASSNYFVIDWDKGAGVSATNPPSINRLIVSTPSYILASTYTTQTYNMGSKASAWGVFTADSVLDPGATITYGIYADTDANLSIDDPTSFVSSQSIMSGQVPMINISSYVTIAAFFSRSSFTLNASLNDVSISWVDGSRLLAPSLYYLQRYWLGVAMSSNTNNVVLVYDNNSQWQRWRGINMNSAMISNSNPYFGNSFGIYRADIGNTDAGRPILAFYHTKRYVPAGLDYISFFDDLYVTAANSADTLQVQYYIDGVNTPYSLASVGMNSFGGTLDTRLPFPAASLQQGRMIDFVFTVNGITQWHLVNANLNFSKETVPKGN